MTRRHSPPLDGALAKSASGALEHVPVALVQNLARALAELKELYFTVIGLDGDATERLEDAAWPERVGAGAGRRGQGPAAADARELRPARAASPRTAPFASLNVSNAAAVALHWAAAAPAGAARSRSAESSAR